MNLLIVSFSVNGSMGDNFKTIAKDLSTIANIYVLTNQGINSEDVGTNNICNIRFDRREKTDFINISSYYKLYKYIKSIHFDVVFIYSPHPVNLFLYQIIDNRKIIPFVHDHILHSGVKRLDAFFLKMQLKYSYKKSAKIIVSCNRIKEEILRLGFMKDAAKIEVNYLGLLDNLCFDELNHKYDLDVLFFGRVEYYKGLDILIDACKLLPQYRFVIAGKGNLKEIHNIDSLPDNCIHINEYISDKDLATYINDAKVIVLPYRDATGTQTIQSVFYYKKPIIATNVGCFPEYITHDVDGIIIPKEDSGELADSIKQLLSNEEKRYILGLNGYSKLSSSFSKRKIADKYIQILESII